jgi:hypothetical protein
MGIEKLKGLQGLKGLSEEARNAWKQQQIDLGKITDNTSWEQQDRLYRNQQYIEKYGRDAFKSTPWQERDTQFERDITLEALEDKYKGDPNIEEYKTLSIKGMQKLIESEHVNTLELQNDFKALEKAKINIDNLDVEDDTKPLTLKERLKSAYETSVFVPTGGIKSQQEIQKEGAQTAYDTKKKISEETYEKIRVEDNENIINSSKKEADVVKGNLLLEYNNGNIAIEDINTLFDEAVKHSTYYKAFKDSKELEDLTPEEKINVISSKAAVSENAGEWKSIETTNQLIQNLISEKQSGLKKFGLTLKNVGVGGVAHIANTALGYYALFQAGKDLDGGESLSNFLQGYNDEGEKLPWYFNPQYWNGVDQFNTFSEAEQNEARLNGGISEFNAITRAGEELEFWNYNTLLESVKMGKYLWSMALMNYIGGVGSNIGAKTVGAKFTKSIFNPRTMLQEGVSNVAKGVHTFGNVAVNMNAAVPMAFSMGLNTYNDTKTEGLESLNKIIDKELADTINNLPQEVVNQAINNYINSDEMQQHINDYLAEIDKELSANPEMKLKVSKEQIRQQIINDTKAEILKDPTAVLNLQLGDALRKGLEDKHKADFDAIEKAAVNAYKVQATVTQFKEMTTNELLRGYLFSKGNRLNIGKDITKNVVEDAAGNLVRVSKPLRKVAPIGKQILGEFADEWFDSHSENFAKGFGLGTYNNITGGLYNPEAYVYSQNLLGNFLAGVEQGYKDVKDGFFDWDGIYEGLIGAISPITNISPSTQIFSKKPANWKQLSFAEKASKYITNPLLSSIAEQNEEDRMLDYEIETVNKVLKDNKEDLLSISQMIQSLNVREEALLNHNLLEAKDAKLKQAFDLLYNLNKFRNNDIAAKSSIVRETYNTIQQYAEGNISEDVITSFVGRSENKDISRENAKVIIQDNAKQLVKIQEEINKINSILNQSEAGRNLSERTRRQLIYNRLFDSDMTERLSQLEESISGNNNISTESSEAAKYGGIKGIQATYRGLIEQLTKTEAFVKELRDELEVLKGKGEALTEEELNRLMEISLNLPYHEQSVLDIERELDALKPYYHDEITEIFDEEGNLVLTDEPIFETLSKEQILALNPEERALMLDVRNLNKYSLEQQQVIKELIKDLKLKDPNLLNDIKDAGVLYRRQKANREAYDRILDNQEIFEEYANYMEKSFQKRASFIAKELVMDKVSDILDNTADEDLKDALFANNIGSAGIREYIKRRPERESILEHLLKLTDLHAAINTVINSVVPDISRNTALKNLALTFIKNANTVDEAMEMLERAIDASTDETFKKDLDTILENLTSYNFLRNAQVKNDRETRIAREKQLEEERKKREAEAKALEEEQKKKDEEDKLDPEKAELLATEDVDLDGDGNVISPSLERQVQQSDVKPEIENIDTTPSPEDVINDATIHFISINPEFDVMPLKTNGVLQQKVGTREGDLLNSYRQFLQERGIKLQDIIDYELAEILKKNPNIQIHFMLTKAKGTKDQDPVQTIMFNVIEYTEDIKEIHDESRGKPITINGKQWLIIGNSGYNPKVGGASAAFYKLYNKIALNRVNYFASNPDGEYYVSPEYTNIKEITTGSRVKKLETDEGVQSRRLSDLLYFEGKYNEERNPMHLGNPRNKVAGYSDLKFGIQKLKNFITVNTTNDDVIVRPNVPTDNLGSVFLLVQAANGKYLPMYIQPSFYNTIFDGKLKERINDILSKCLSRDYNTRLDAIKQLCGLLVLTEEDNILIGDKNTNVVSIKRNGTVYKTFNLNNPSPTLVSDFFAAVTSLNPRINITESTLRNGVALAEFDEAGALMLDLASLATRNAFYSVYNVGEDGKPIKGETIDIPIEEPSNITNAKVTTVPYSGKLYKYIDKKYYTFEGEEITDANLIEELEINRIIDTNNLAPIDSKNGNAYYIIDDNPDNPVVVKRTGSRHIVKATKETALEIIAKYKAEQEAKAKAEAAKQELNLEQQFTGVAEDVLLEEVPDVAQQLVGNFTEQTTPQTTSVIQPEVKDKQEVKENINEVGGKSLENLHNSDNLTTFVDIIKNMGHKSTLKKIFTAKGWKWTGNPKKLEEFLKSKGIATVGINNIDNWFDMIKNCK